MTPDRLHLLNLRNMAETLTEAMQAGAFVTNADACDLVAHIEGMGAESVAIIDPEMRVAGMRIATAISRIARAYMDLRVAVR